MSMPMSTSIETINESSTEFEHLADYIEQQLLQSLRSELVQSENHSFILTAKSKQNEVVAGLSASSSYGWLLIKTLWVKESYRAKGLGKQLMAKAEAHGTTLGCHTAWLDTSNPDAEQFYRNNGYCEFGRLENTPEQCPPSHKRWFMKKTL